MEKYQGMKSFCLSASEYFKHPSESTASILQRNLGTINSSTDLSIFDPGNIVTSEFYMCLYNLANSLELRSPLIWSTLDVLQHACKNFAARQNFIHTYKFAPILSKLLENNLIPEKQIKILRLLQELTYGVKIHWQEAHLPHLISTLTQWITQSKEENVVSLSLSILINLCYRNLPVLNILPRAISTKTLHKMLLNHQKSNLNTRVQICKLLIITEHIHKDIPDREITEFIVVTFQSIISALKKQDALVLKHIVEFFDDMRQKEHSISALTSYENYFNDVNNVLQRLNESIDPECAALILEFFSTLVKLKVSSLLPLYSEFIKFSIDWISCMNNNQVTTKALSLLRNIIAESRRNRSFADIFSSLDLKSLISSSINQSEINNSNDKQSNLSLEINTKLTELVQLLSELTKITNLRSQVTEAFNEQMMKKLLRPVCEQEYLNPPGHNWPGHLLNDPSASFYIHALSLTADLSNHYPNWLSLYTEMIQKKQIQMTIALAIFNGDGEVKQKALELLTTSFPHECVVAVSKCLLELQPLLLIQNKSGLPPIGVEKSESFHSILDLTQPSLSSAQEGQVDDTLAILNDLVEQGKITDIKTTAIMELYEHKLSALRYSEQANHANLQAADNFVAQLQHRLAQVLAESNRLHQLLFHSHQNLESIQAEKEKMNVKLQEAEKQTKKIHTDTRSEIQGLRKIVEEKSGALEKLKKECDEATEVIDSLKKKIKEYESDIDTNETKIKELTTKSQELNKILSKMQEKLSQRDQLTKAKEKEIEEFNKAMSALKQENEQLTRQCRGYEQEIAEKEEVNAKMVEEIKELSRMRDMIFQITAKKKDSPNETT